MSESFYTILTNAGLAAIANATVNQKQVNFAKIGVGDGNGAYYTPTQEATALRKQVWIGNVSSVTTDPENANWVVVETVIPGNVGGFEIRELGIFDENNVLLAIGKLPLTYKPNFAEGSSKDLYIKAIFEVTNASAVTLKVDPSVIYASKKYVDDKVATVVSGLENVQQQLNQHAAAIDTKVDKHIEQDDGHVRYLGSSSATNDMIVSNDNLTLPLESDGKIKIGSAFRFRKDTTNTGALTMQLKLKGITYPKYQVLTSRGKAFTGGEMIGGGMYTLVFNGSAFFLQGEGGGYYTGDTIKAKDLVNRTYMVTNEINPVDINNLSDAASFLKSEIATINGVEYAFAYSNSFSTGQKFYCWEVLTGQIRWIMSPPSGYSYHTRIIVYNDRLYVGVFGRDDTIALNGYGLEILNPITGARIALVGGTVPSSYADRAADISLWDNGTTKEVLLLTTNYDNKYVWIARFNATSGSFLGVSANLGGNHTDLIPNKMQTVGDYIFLASSKCMYQHKGASFSYTGKVPFTYEYQLLGLAANNAGGISVIHVYGAVYVYSTSLAQLSSFGIQSSEASGISIKGDLMSCANRSGVYMYRLAADAKTASYIETITAPCDLSNITTISNVGFSENAVIPPLNATRVVPSVLSKTLKIKR